MSWNASGPWADKVLCKRGMPGVWNCHSNWFCVTQFISSSWLWVVRTKGSSWGRRSCLHQLKINFLGNSFAALHIIETSAGNLSLVLKPQFKQSSNKLERIHRRQWRWSGSWKASFKRRSWMNEMGLVGKSKVIVFKDLKGSPEEDWRLFSAAEKVKKRKDGRYDHEIKVPPCF